MKRGFTLIELLAVITILSIIILIASVSLSNVLKDSKEDLSNSQITAIKEAAKSWSSDNIDILPSGNNCSFLTLKDLKEDGLIDEEIIDPKDKKNISNDLKIKIESKMNGTGNSNLTYEVNPDSIKDCLYIGSDMYVDLPKGLTPVIYDGTNWKVPKENEEWYNYDKQMWANAVVLGSGKTKKPGEIVTVEGDNPDALMMLVYIPRYEYKIEGQYGTHTDGTPGTANEPGEIEVKFVNNSKITADDGYILHPAFKFDGEKSGFWVGKFELSHSDETKSETSLECTTDTCSEAQYLRILPNKPSLRYNDVSNFFYAIRSIEKTNTFGISNMDTHMMKNSEWGAVAYLSQSKYGKYGNNDYENKYKEVYQNKSNTYITGLSNGTPSQEEYREGGQCSYNDMTNLGVDGDNYKMGLCGPGASTTGNIYGIYDMSGGSDEHVMMTLSNSDGIYTGTEPCNSGFIGIYIDNDEKKITGAEPPELKYYDDYSDWITSDYKNDKNLSQGHALLEVKNWYNDIQMLNNIPQVNIWFTRGGNDNMNSGAGIFNSHYGNYGFLMNSTTRVIFIPKY